MCEGLIFSTICPPEALMPWVESAESINMICGSKKYGKKGVPNFARNHCLWKRTSFPHKLCTVGSFMSYFEEKWFESSPLATYPEKEEVCRLNSLRSFDLGEIFRHLSEKYRSVKSSPGLPLFHPDSRFLPPCTPYEKFHGPTSELLCIIKTKTWHNKETGYIFLGLLIGPSHGEQKKIQPGTESYTTTTNHELDFHFQGAASLPRRWGMKGWTKSKKYILLNLENRGRFLKRVYPGIFHHLTPTFQDTEMKIPPCFPFHSQYTLEVKHH